MNKKQASNYQVDKEYIVNHSRKGHFVLRVTGEETKV